MPTIKEPSTKPVLPNPAPIKTRAIKWVVLTPKHFIDNDKLSLVEAEVAKAIQDYILSFDFVFFGILPEDYADLSMTQADTLRWVNEAYWRLEYYREPVPDNKSEETEDEQQDN